MGGDDSLVDGAPLDTTDRTEPKVADRPAPRPSETDDGPPPGLLDGARVGQHRLVDHLASQVAGL